MKVKQVFIVFLLSFLKVNFVCQGLKTLDTSETMAVDADISVLVRQAIERGEGTAVNQRVLESAGVPLQESKKTMDGLLLSLKKRRIMDTKELSKPVKRENRNLGHQPRASNSLNTEKMKDTPFIDAKKHSRGGEPVADFTPTRSVYDQKSSLETKGDFMESYLRATPFSSSSTRDNTDYEFVLQGTHSVTSRSPLKLTLLPMDKTNERLQTAYKNANLPEGWETISESENAKKKSSRDSRDERQTVNEWEAIQEEDTTEKDDEKDSARGSRRKFESSSLVKPKKVVHEDSSRQSTARMRRPYKAKHQEMKTPSGIRSTVSHAHADRGRKIDNKSHEIKKKKKEHSLDPTDSGSLMDSQTLVIAATVCVGIMVFLLIITGLARVWKNRRNVPRKCHGAKLGFIVSLNAGGGMGGIDELSDQEIIYESSMSHLELSRKPTSTSATESYPPNPRYTLPFYKPTNYVLVNAECGEKSSDEEIIYERSSSQVYKKPTSCPENSDEEASDGEIIYDSRTSFVGAFKTAPFATALESGVQNPQSSVSSHKLPTNHEVNANSDDEFSDGELIYDSPSCHVAVFKKTGSTLAPGTSVPFYKPSNCVSVNIESDEELSDEVIYEKPGVPVNIDIDGEFSDGEIIYESPTCHIAVLKKPAKTWTPASREQTQRATPPSYEPTDYVLVNAESYEELSDGEIVSANRSQCISECRK